MFLKEESKIIQQCCDFRNSELCCLNRNRSVLLLIEEIECSKAWCDRSKEHLSYFIQKRKACLRRKVYLLALIA